MKQSVNNGGEPEVTEDENPRGALLIGFTVSYVCLQ